MNHRLLHAAARGARVQYRYFDERDWWTTYCLDTNKGSAAPDCVYRIHPDDEHLAYGPISTALREAASEGRRWDLTGLIGTMAHAAGNYHGPWWMEPELNRSLFLLILSESLADEGL
jgi:hypothetical protein